MPFIEVVEEGDARGRLREIYDSIIESRGKLADVHMIQSLNPESITAHMDLYMTVMFGSSPLSRAQREMMAVVVSAANGCEYCQVHHCRALRHHWKDEERVEVLRSDWESAELDSPDVELCRYAWNLSLEPGRAAESRYASGLRSAGFSDRAILDATLVTAYFNFVNRVVMGLGVETEDDPGGYRYD
jgi:uncharacterized peroxidase-related enzyme